MCHILEAAHSALYQLQTPWMTTRGLLIKDIQQRGMLLCDNDVDIEILECEDGCVYDRKKKAY